MDISGKKLLVLGGVAMIMELVEDARRRGAYVIVSDYYATSPAKKIADESWETSTADTDELAKRCIEAGVDGVMAAFDDFNVRCAARLSEKIGKPFYATFDQTEITMDKQKFKALCIDNAVPCTPAYDLDDELSDELLKQIKYPVIIKPVDGSGARGITICSSEAELRAAFVKAKTTSKKGSIILEKYIVGDEVGVNYVLADGEVMPSVLHDRYMQDGDGMHVRLPVAYVYPSKYTKTYLEKENDLVVSMFKSIGMANGTLFMQGCVDNGTVLFYEMGYRLNGAKQYQLLDRACGYNPMQMIVNYSLTGKMSDDPQLKEKVNPFLDAMYCTLSILARPAKINKIIGLDEIKGMEETVAVTQWYAEGDEITEDALGTQKQICMRITLRAKDTAHLAETIRRVYKTLQVLDEKDESILLKQFDTNKLFEE